MKWSYLDNLIFEDVISLLFFYKGQIQTQTDLKIKLYTPTCIVYGCLFLQLVFWCAAGAEQSVDRPNGSGMWELSGDVTWVVHYVCRHLLWSHVSRDGDFFSSRGNLSERADHQIIRPQPLQMKEQTLQIYGKYLKSLTSNIKKK